MIIFPKLRTNIILTICGVKYKFVDKQIAVGDFAINIYDRYYGEITNITDRWVNLKAQTGECGVLKPGVKVLQPV